MSAIETIRKGLIQNSTVVNSNVYRQMPTGGKWFFSPGGYQDVYFNYSGHGSSLTAFEKCPPLNAVINKKSKAFINGKTWILNKSGKAKGKVATGEVANKVNALLTKPNIIQNWKQFEAQYYVYLHLFEWFIVLPIGVPVGFPKYEATSMWIIPPSMVDIEETNKLFLQSRDTNGLKKIVLNYQDERTELLTSSVFIIRGTNPSFKSFVFPESRVCSLEMPINNIIGAYESRNVLINYRGALGIISPDAKDVGGPIPLKADDKQQLQDDFMNYGLKNNQWKFIISNASIKWSQMGVPTKDLMLFEEIEDDVQRICDSFDYPYRLMASEKSNSLGGSDVREFKKLLYQDAIIPEADMIYEQWQSFFDLDSYGLEMIKDFSHVAALQEDQVNVATARFQRNRGLLIEFQNNLITLNEWRTHNGDDPIDEPWGEFYYHQLVAAGIVMGSGQAGSNVPDNINPSSTTSADQNNNQQ